MNKKLFSWKALAGVALFAALTMGLQSCTQTPEPEPEPGPTPVTPLVIDGTTITFNGFVKLSDINNVLAALAGNADATVNVTIDGKTVAVKCPKGTLKANGTYNITINNSKIKVSATDYTLTIPECTDAIFNLTLAEKFAEVKNTIVIEDEALDYLHLTLAEDTYDLTLDMEATTAIVDGAAKIGTLTTIFNQYNVYDFDDYWGINRYQTFGGRFCALLEGLQIGTINPINGYTIVDGAQIEALGVNGLYGYARAYHYAYGFVTSDDFGAPYQNLVNADGTVHYLHSITVDGNAHLYSYSKANPAQKVYLKQGAFAYFNYRAEELEDAQRNHYYYNEIIGLGDGSATIQCWDNMNGGWFAFQDVKTITNVTINPVTSSSYLRLFPDIVKCTVLSDYVYFYVTTQEVKDSKFPNAYGVYFIVDARNGSTAYQFNYNNCEFPANTTLGVSDFETEDVLLDADGNPVVYAIWRYAEVDENGNYTGNWLEVKGEVGKVPSVVPTKSRKEGNCYFRIVEAKEFTQKINDMTITTGLGGKMGGVAITAQTENLNIAQPNNVYWYADPWETSAYKAEMTYKYLIGGKLYRYAYDTISGDWIFVTTK
jgi:hypothetical protein